MAVIAGTSDQTNLRKLGSDIGTLKEKGRDLCGRGPR